jgi:hypothetical protein
MDHSASGCNIKKDHFDGTVCVYYIKLHHFSLWVAAIGNFWDQQAHWIHRVGG